MPTVPVIEEPPVTEVTSTSGGAHNEGNPGAEKVAQAGANTAGEPSGAMQNPPVVAELVTSTTG